MSLMSDQNPKHVEDEPLLLRVRLTQGAIDNGYIHFPLEKSIFPLDTYGNESGDQKGKLVTFVDELGKVYVDDIRRSENRGRIRARFGAYFRKVGATEGDEVEIKKVGPYEYRLNVTCAPASPHPKHADTKTDDFKGTSMKSSTALPPKPMNIIFYGPPGTGKTFTTTRKAVELCIPDWPASKGDSETKLKFDELKAEGRISFVSFHQSYGYEDFIEGLRPQTNPAGHISYSILPGAFKKSCTSARLTSLVAPGLSGKPLKARGIYKMSLGASRNNEGVEVFRYCLENQCVLIGWGDDTDFSDCKTLDDIVSLLKQESPDLETVKSQASFVHRLKHELKVGDIIIVSDGNRFFRAIAEVTGEYEFDEDGPFHQSRPVKWLAVFEGKRPVSEINPKDFTMKSLHALRDVNYEALEKLITPKADTHGPLPHVIVIDEINRANISKVFGELITLLEHDKREVTSVKLAYSGEEFSVPANLHVLGTMNTADRSIALLDTALRRRFEFIELPADPLHLPIDVEGINLRALLTSLNERIECLYDRDHTIGHAYLMNVETLDELKQAFRVKIIPLLQEYFYEDWSKVKAVLNDSADRFIETISTSPSVLKAFFQDFEPPLRYRVRSEFEVEAFRNIYEAQ
jgi:5-methylcytosine-specific restriction protein B